MGTWDHDPFGNDTACDWKYDLEESEGYQLIESALDEVIAVGQGEVDSTDAEIAIAAADTIARLRGHFYVRNAYTESLDEWVSRQKNDVPQMLVDKALIVIDRIMTEPSELLDLWNEAGDDSWKESMGALKARLLLPPLKVD